MLLERYTTGDKRKTQEKEGKTQEKQVFKKLELEEKQKNKLKHLRDIEGTSFMQLIDYVRELLHIETEKEKSVTPLLEDAQGEVKRQLGKCKKDHMSYLVILGGEHYPSEIGWIGKY